MQERASKQVSAVAHTEEKKVRGCYILGEFLSGDAVFTALGRRAFSSEDDVVWGVRR